MGNGIKSDARDPGIREVLQRHHTRYEVSAYYAVWERRPVGAAQIDQRIQAGFDVDLYGLVDKMQFPRFHSDEGRKVLEHFETVAKEIRSKTGEHGTTIEIMPREESLVLDTHQHLQPEVMLRIRIGHDRGLDQPNGPAEEQALQAVRETLHQLGVKQA